MARQVDYLSIQISGKSPHEVPLTSLLVFLNESRSMLRELDGHSTLEWVLRDAVFSNPLLMELAAETDLSEYDANVVTDYLRVMQHVNGDGPLPRRATPAILRRARRAARVVDSDGILAVELRSPGRDSVSVRGATTSPATHAEVIALGGAIEYDDLAQIEGTLETVSHHGGFKVYVWDRVTRRKTECTVSRPVLNQALDAMKHATSPRVAVYGKAKYRQGNPTPMSIVAESITVLTQVDESQDPRHFQGLDITDGMDSVEYIRGLRNDG